MPSSAEGHLPMSSEQRSARMQAGRAIKKAKKDELNERLKRMRETATRNREAKKAIDKKNGEACGEKAINISNA